MTEAEWSDLINFEGNAQGFRLLTGVEHLGLKLSDQTLAAFTKYPRGSKIQTVDAQRKSQKKFGYYQSEGDKFKALANGLGLKELIPGEAWCRHPLAFLVEAADDICYHIIDLEDGCRLGLVSEAQTTELLAAILGERYKPQKLKAVPGVEQRIGLLRALTIGELIDQSAQIFLDHETEILEGTFDQALTDLIPASAILDDIIKLSLKHLYRSKTVLEIEAAGYQVLGGLLEKFITAVYNKHFQPTTVSKKDHTLYRLLPETIQYQLNSGEPSEYQVARILLDYVGGFTDKYAISLYRKLQGISLPSS